MKSVPSLVASSTVAAAATGLVFGKPQHTNPPRPSSNKRKASDYEIGNRLPALSQSRPATSSTLRTPARRQEYSTSLASNSRFREPVSEQTFQTPSESMQRAGRGASATRRRGSTPAHESGSDDRKDSLSSRGSWYKRLSAIPMSQGSGSPRSSVGPDSPSVQLSHGSAAPILHSPADTPAQLPPNKLVKRAYSGRVATGEHSRSGSRSQVPTLRRPATSHQRSATLQQQFREQEIAEFSSQSASSPESQEVVQIPHSSTHTKTYYRHYFEPRTTRLAKERLSGRGVEGYSPAAFSISKRVTVPDNFEAPTLLKAGMIINSIEIEEPFADFDTESSAVVSSLENTPEPFIDSDPHKRPKRSLSTHFSSPTSWITRTGSLRASKRGDSHKSTGRRYASAPLPRSNSRDNSTASPQPMNSSSNIESPSSKTNHVDTELLSPTSRGSSSPLPVLSRLSSFNLDLARMGLSSSSSGRQTPTSPSPLLSSQLSFPNSAREKSLARLSPTVVVHQSQPRVRSMASDKASTLVDSDNEIKDYIMAEDEDTDFQSESVFDSYRTGHTGSTRVRSPALDSLFDDSPISSSSRSKGLAINDNFGNPSLRDSPNRIMEEDEGLATPVRETRMSTDESFITPTRKEVGTDDKLRSSPPSFSLAAQNFGRLSLEDDDEDEDWTKDDESVAFSNSLSPPSTLNSSRINPQVRLALASASGNVLPLDDRPKSVFDWSEPSVAEKPDIYGQSPRPRTVHGKQAMLDGRGGRAVGRRGPSALHIRSQSVPVVPQLTGEGEANKSSKKFGTWGLGGKGASEDWDNDFEFDGPDTDVVEAGELSMTNSMVVPAAIQATQASVVGHVGQIREVCLLVEDLKRLRGQAKEKGLLHGSSASLWRRAEGYIALAAPDEEDAAFSPPRSPIGQSSRHESISEQVFEVENDAVGQTSSPTAVEQPMNDRPTRFENESFHNRRRSVFSPDDDIFGVVESTEEIVLPKHSASTRSKESIDAARSVMAEIHQHRIVSDPLQADFADEIPSVMPFDTTSLRDLIQRASSLARVLAETIRRHDSPFQSPNRSPEHRREDRDSSPAFTRVFTPDNLATPPPLPRSQSNNSGLNTSLEGSPTRRIEQRMHMMTVV